MAIRPETKKFYSSFAKAVVDARKGLGMSAADVGEKVGFDAPVISKVETGRGPGGIAAVPLHLGLKLISTLGLEETGGGMARLARASARRPQARVGAPATRDRSAARSARTA